MEETLKDVLKKKSTNISINKNRYKKILNDIMLEIKNNKEEFKRVNDIDKNILWINNIMEYKPYMIVFRTIERDKNERIGQSFWNNNIG